MAATATKTPAKSGAAPRMYAWTQDELDHLLIRVEEGAKAGIPKSQVFRDVAAEMAAAGGVGMSAQKVSARFYLAANQAGKTNLVSSEASKISKRSAAVRSGQAKPTRRRRRGKATSTKVRTVAVKTPAAKPAQMQLTGSLTSVPGLGEVQAFITALEDRAASAERERDAAVARAEKAEVRLARIKGLVAKA